MAINHISGISHVMPDSIIAQREKVEAPKTDFSVLLQNALGDTMKTDFDNKMSNIGVMTDASMDVHDTMIASEKAGITLSLTLQIRNKIVDAYNEVMRMQV